GELGNGYHPEMEKLHKENAQYLKNIIERIGFPTISKVGQKASDVAWLIIPELMKSSYQLIPMFSLMLADVKLLFVGGQFVIFSSSRGITTENMVPSFLELST
ncbi:MAG: hypothetical protein K0R36_3842, partial [Chryseobacterium sp.]|nr:hypothetical protein [Chryseobacterium sp.]